MRAGALVLLWLLVPGMALGGGVATNPPVWEARVESAVDEAPADLVVSGGRAVVATRAGHDHDWALRAFDAETGELDWTRVPKTPRYGEYVSSLVEAAGRLFTVSPGKFRGVRRGSGSVAWQRSFRGEDSNSAGPYLAALDRRAFVLGVQLDRKRGRRLWAYRAGSGKRSWKKKLGLVHPAAVVTGSKKVFAIGNSFDPTARGHWIGAYGARHGNLAWEERGDPLDLAQITAGVVADGRLFVAGGLSGPAVEPGFIVFARGAETGQKLWEDRIYEGHRLDDRFYVRNLVVTGDVLVVAIWRGGEWSHLRAYRASSGELLWDLQEPRSALTWEIAAYEGGVVAVGSTRFDNQLWVRAFDPETGALLWEDRSDEARSYGSHVVIDDGRAFVAGVRPNRFEPGDDETLVRAYDLR